MSGHYFFKLPGVALVALLASCTSYQDSSLRTLGSTLSGEQVAAELTTRYADVRSNCGADSKPAFLCAGLLVRGTKRSDNYDPWNPSPTSQINGGVSFAFIRSDYKVKRLAFNYSSGFIFAPILKRDGSSNIPVGKYLYQVLCFFPVDGVSDERPDGGCGANPSYPAVSMSCELQNPPITTGEQWYAHAKQHVSTKARCSFNVRDSQNQLAGPRFIEGMKGGRGVSGDRLAFHTPNDTKIATWDQNIPAQLPIEAFIYIASTGAVGLDEAQDYQRRYRSSTGVTVPIIRVAMPQTLEETTSFTYQLSDQN